MEAYNLDCPCPGCKNKRASAEAGNAPQSDIFYTSDGSQKLSEKSTTFAAFTFNPTKDIRVDHIKATTDALINFVKGHAADGDGDQKRRAALAVSNYEQAAMWAVKSLFSSTKADAPSPVGGIPDWTGPVRAASRQAEMQAISDRTERLNKKRYVEAMNAREQATEAPAMPEPGSLAPGPMTWRPSDGPMTSPPVRQELHAGDFSILVATARGRLESARAVVAAAETMRHLASLEVLAAEDALNRLPSRTRP